MKITRRRARSGALAPPKANCSEILDVNMTTYVHALAEAGMASEAGRICSWDHKVVFSAKAISELQRWTSECSSNRPTHVTRGARLQTGDGPTTSVWVDASIWGWGAVVIPPDGKVRHLSSPWTDADADEVARQGGRLGSSVFAEPLALRKAICSCSLGPGAKMRLWSDHASMVTIAQAARYSLVPSYNDALSLLLQLSAAGIDVQVGFVAGAANPADSLSRGRAPLLEVTNIGPNRYG